MPTAVRDVDAQRPPPDLAGLHGYDSALVLVRWGGVPVGKLTLPVYADRVDGAVLRQGILDVAAEAIWRLSLNDYLGWNDADPGP
ncbi:MAG: hypothetical protein M3466_08570, partial [Gemmatimonadota bacterium]|nr:hypothetical protein [Gemmatimonadota bacterium]